MLLQDAGRAGKESEMVEAEPRSCSGGDPWPYASKCAYGSKCVDPAQLREKKGHRQRHAGLGGEANGARPCSQRGWLPCHERTAGPGDGGYDPGTVSRGSQGIQRMDVIGMREGSIVLLPCVPESHHSAIFRKWLCLVGK